MTDEVEEFLAHFGVKGMRWGVVHKVDTTTGLVDRSTETRAQLRETKREAKAQNFDAIAASYNKRLDRAVSVTDRQILTSYRDRAARDAEAVRNHKMTSSQKKIAIGAAVAGTILVGAVTVHYLNTGEFARMQSKGFKNIRDRTSEIHFPKNAKFTQASTADDVFSTVVHGVNPHYGTPGTMQNCRRTAFAYEMRRRGYDVRATKTTNAYGQNVQGLINAITPGSNRPTGHRIAVKTGMTEAYSKKFIGGENKIGKPVLDSFPQLGNLRPSAKEIFDTLANQPDKSRGEISLGSDKFGNHSIVYELFDGKPVLFDVQRNKKFDSPESFEVMAKHIDRAGFTRLDDKPLNTNFLAKWVTSSGK